MLKQGIRKEYVTTLHRCWLHTLCVIVKCARGTGDWRWHWEHIQREFGLGPLCGDRVADLHPCCTSAAPILKP